MKQLSILMAIAATCVSSMQAIFFVTGKDGNLVWYASCRRIVAQPGDFDNSSDRFYREYEDCHWSYLTSKEWTTLENLINKKRLEIIRDHLLTDIEKVKLKPLIKRHVLCKLAGDGEMATNGICTANEKKLQDFLSAVANRTN